MKKIFLLLIFLFSAFVQTQEIRVDERMSDIYFANGILTTRDDAWASSKLISDATRKDIYNSNTAEMKRFTDFKLLYNHTYNIGLDILEAISQKKGEHKYFWIALSAIMEVSGKLEKEIAKGVTEEALNEYFKRVLTDAFLNELKNHILDRIEEETNTAGITNTIEAITADAKSKSFTKAITAVVEILEQLDLNEQSKDIQTSIISDIQLIFV